MSRRLEWRKDDGGRKEAGFRGEHAHDCVIRAVTIATGEPYRKVHEELATLNEQWTGRGVGNGIDWAVTRKAMEKRGWRYTRAPARKIDQIFLRPGEIPMKGTVLVQLRRHAVTVRDGVMLDTWNPDQKGYTRVVGYWTKRGR